MVKLIMSGRRFNIYIYFFLFAIVNFGEEKIVPKATGIHFNSLVSVVSATKRQKLEEHCLNTGKFQNPISKTKNALR